MFLPLLLYLHVIRFFLNLYMRVGVGGGRDYSQTQVRYVSNFLY